MTELIRYDTMIRAITECHSVDEVKDIRDKAMALEHYARMAQNTDAERKACEIRLRAEKQAGRMLSVMEKAKASPGNQYTGKVDPSHDVSGPLTLSEIGITHNQSSRWQKLAAVPDDVFEAALADPEETPSTTAIIRKANGGSSKMHPDALWIWGRVMDWERMRIEENDTQIIAGEMTATMHASLRRILPGMIAWLTTLEGEIDE